MARRCGSACRDRAAAPPPRRRAPPATGRGAGPSSCAVDRLWLREECVEDVVDRAVVLLLEARVRDPGHHRELLVGVRQTLEELHQVVEAGNAIVFAA